MALNSVLWIGLKFLPIHPLYRTISPVFETGTRRFHSVIVIHIAPAPPRQIHLTSYARCTRIVGICGEQQRKNHHASFNIAPLTSSTWLLACSGKRADNLSRL
jgi:hypothetical protein